MYGIVAQSSGYIEVDSAPGRGTTFHVLLPAAHVGALDPAPVHDSAVVPRAERVAVVLLVEDEDSLRQVAERMLRKHGYSVIAAASPDDALNLLVETGAVFDCLVTDVVMPGMSGQELAARIRELRGPVPVLLLSGYARDAIDRRGPVNPAIPLLHKPVKPAELMRAIATLLRSPVENEQHSATDSCFRSYERDGEGRADADLALQSKSVAEGVAERT